MRYIFIAILFIGVGECSAQGAGKEVDHKPGDSWQKGDTTMRCVDNPEFLNKRLQVISFKMDSLNKLVEPLVAQFKLLRKNQDDLLDAFYLFNKVDRTKVVGTGRTKDGNLILKLKDKEPKK